MHIKRMIVNNLETSQRDNQLSFCKNYRELSESYFNMADETSIKAIDGALEQTLIDRQMGKKDGALGKFSEEQLIGYFERKKIKLYKMIPEELSRLAQEKINELLRKNNTYAADSKMIVPSGNEKLTMEQYYYNYKKAIEMIQKLELLFVKSK